VVNRGFVRRWSTVVALMTTVALAVLAVRSDGGAAEANGWMTALDLTVGLAFVAGAVGVRASFAAAALLTLTGCAWLAGSSWSQARPWHQAVLVVVLIAFPRGRIRGVSSWFVAGLSTLVALGLLSQLGIAAVFAAAAASVALRWAVSGRAMFYPAVAASALGAILALEWLLTRHAGLDPTLALVSYEVVLLGVAIGYPLATRAEARADSGLADRLFSEPKLPPLDGLAGILRQALGDPSVEIYRWHGSRYVDGSGRAASGRTQADRWLEVAGGGEPLAALTHRSVALDDPRTAEAVSSAVRLAVTHLRLQDEQQTRLNELQAARSRIVAATDRERRQVAMALRREVEPALREANSCLRLALDGAPTSGAATLSAAALALSDTTTLIAGLVAGIAPARLGDGRLAAALAALAKSSPLPVTVTMGTEARGDEDEETALFYVCSETLVNAIKHAAASRVEIAVDRVADGLQAKVSDDGRGGADPQGSGLQGLADRLATVGGRLTVISAPEAGTSVIATIPD
jgi:signal transduction histidine kinase